jgi:NAD(P)-dependent dehydrogenase (short-subunit alcohol dehydrogenase family)
LPESLEGKEVILAGGSGGLGSATAELLAAEGARLVVSYRSNAERAARLKKIATVIQADLALPADRERLLDAAPHVYALVVFSGDPARILAKECRGPVNIRVNVIAPGVTAAGMAEASIASGKYNRYIDEGTIPRFGRAADVARAVRFFLEPDSYVTGQVLTVDGGLTL